MTDDQSQEVRLALLERDLKDQRDRSERMLKALEDQGVALRRATAAPPKVEMHEGRATASCPSCGTSTSFDVPDAGPKTFDDVLGLLDAPLQHAGGKTFKDCPDCKPKADAKFAALGYVPKPIAVPAEE